MLDPIEHKLRLSLEKILESLNVQRVPLTRDCTLHPTLS